MTITRSLAELLESRESLVKASSRDIVVNTEPSWIINKRLEEARSKLSKADAAGKPVTASEAQILQFRQDVLEEDRAAKRQQQQQNVEEFERRFASSVRPPAPSTSAVTVTAAPRAVENSALEQPMPPRSTEKVDFLKSILGDTISRSHGKVVPGLGHVKGGEHEGDAEALPQRVMIS